MKIVYEADIKVKIIIENEALNIPKEDIPTKEEMDKGIAEMITDELGTDATCEIKVESKYELS